MSSFAKSLRVRTPLTLVLGALLLGSAFGPVMRPAPVAPGAARQPASAVTKQQANANLDKMALSFEENRGQSDAQVRYLARGKGYTAFLTDQEAVIVYSAPHALSIPGQGNPPAAPSASQAAVLRYQLQGANPAARPVAAAELPGKQNYLLGNDRAKWYTDIRTFGRVTYPAVYPGVDMAYHGSNSGLEYDFVVAPGADPAAIKMHIAGAASVQLEGGALVMQTALGPVRQSAPHIYQDGAAGQETVQGSFTLQSDGTVGFQLSQYDASRPVVIDPITYSSYLGGGDSMRSGDGGDWAIDVTEDSANNAYVTGATDSLTFPVTAGAYQTVVHNFFVVFVTKIAADGSSKIWSTVIGGTEPGANNTTDAWYDVGNGIVLDSLNQPVISGYSSSLSYPSTTGRAKQGPPTDDHFDAILTKLNAAGNGLVYSTYIGGGTAGDADGVNDDYGYDVALLPGSDTVAYLVGATDVPTGNVGGSGGSFPITAGAYKTTNNGSYDAFIARIDMSVPATFTLTYSTFLGGTGQDMVGLDSYYGEFRDDLYHEGGIAVDTAGNAYVAGYVSNGSAGFPTTNGYQTTCTAAQCAFLTKINPAGTGALDVVYSTLFGTTGNTHASDIKFAGANTITTTVVIAGYTEGLAAGDPTAGAYQTTYGGNGDGFIAKFNTALTAAASRIYATYVGGANYDQIFGIDTNTAGYIGFGGASTGGIAPTGTERAYTAGGGNDAFAGIIDPARSGAAQLIYATYLGGSEADNASAVDLSGTRPPGPATAEMMVVGNTRSYNTTTNFPIFPTMGTPPFQPVAGNGDASGPGKAEAFVTKLAVPLAPTAAQVRAMAAAPAGKTGVIVQWNSASEAAHLGYNVLRADSKAGTFHVVNGGLIVGDTTLGGGTHRYTDAGGTADSLYKIQAVDTHNRTQDSAAFGVGKLLPPVMAAPDKAAQAAEAAAFAAANAVSPVRNQAQTLTTTPYKLTVSQSGIARVTYEQLQAAGVPLAGVVADRLTLTTGSVASRVVVPLALHVANPAGFAPGDSFDFIAQNAPSPYGDSRAYLLSQSATSGLHMGSSGVAGGVPSVSSPGSFRSTVHSEENNEYWQYDVNMGAPQPEGPWYWTDTYFSPDTTATVQAPNYAGGAASMTVHLQGITSDDSLLVDHHLQLRLNGTLVSDRTWHGLAVQDIVLTLPAGLLQAGANTLALHTVADTGAAQDNVVLASVDTTYNRAYQALANSLRFTPTSNGNRRLVSVTVGGFTSAAVALYDVTNPAAPRQVPASVTSSGGSYSVQAQVPRGDVQTLVAAAGSGLVPITAIAPVAAGDLHSGSADYVIVAYDSMISAAQQLAAQEQAAGLTTTVVPVSAIYDQFGAGVPDAAAIHAFFAATAQWSHVPQYAVLLGSASYDSHGYTQSGAPDLVPTAYVLTHYMGRTASDMALVTPTNGTLPTLALGRLPARTPSEATALVAKLGAYRSTAHTWGTQASLVADSGEDQATFESASEVLAGTLGSTTFERLYAGQLGTGTSAAIINSLNAGRAVLNYYGHGSYQFWSGSNFFNLTSVNSLTNTGHEAFITAMSCQSGDYDWAIGTSLLNALLLKPQGGAIGAIGATGASTSDGQEQLNEAVYGRLLSGARLGDALRAGYAATTDSDVRAQFHLLGDPAMRLDLGAGATR
ncbi:MAG: C25 family cysteine peptidase [Chloroflexota bacterium]|nr:C25 family cysteine peptidase [Chloroflexota bacterium]